MLLFAKKWTPLLLILFVLFTACNKENISPARDYHQLTTHPVTAVGTASATLNAEILSAGKEPIREYGFVWDKTQPLIEQQTSQVIRLASPIETGKFSANLESQFEGNTVYYVRSFVRTETTTVYGNTVSFKAQH